MTISNISQLMTFESCYWCMHKAFVLCEYICLIHYSFIHMGLHMDISSTGHGMYPYYLSNNPLWTIEYCGWWWLPIVLQLASTHDSVDGLHHGLMCSYIVHSSWYFCTLFGTSSLYTASSFQYMNVHNMQCPGDQESFYWYEFHWDRQTGKSKNWMSTLHFV